MKTQALKTVSDPGTPYAEESPRFAIGIAIAVVVLVGVPLGLFNKKLMDEGSRADDVSKLSALSIQVGGTVASVRALLERGVEEGVALVNVKPPTATVAVTNKPTPSPEDPLQLNGIYWNPYDPIVTIANEIYRNGDKVNGYLILEIKQSSVVFRSPLGDTVVKFLDEDFKGTKKP